MQLDLVQQLSEDIRIKSDYHSDNYQRVSIQLMRASTKQEDSSIEDSSDTISD